MNNSRIGLRDSFNGTFGDASSATSEARRFSEALSRTVRNFRGITCLFSRMVSIPRTIKCQKSIPVISFLDGADVRRGRSRDTLLL